MLLANFDFNLPEELIAQFPLQKRSSSRLLCLNRATGEITHHHFKDLPEILNPQDLIIFNNTKVIPARLYAYKPTGGKAEILIERILDNEKALAQIKTRKTLKINDKLIVEQDSWFEVISRQDNFVELRLHSPKPLNMVIEKLGHTPLPPYIKRQSNIDDEEQYQTIYAKHAGAVAAPTAGLHFDHELMDSLHKKNIQTDFVTLHVGMGTFKPVRVERIEDHEIHSEYINVSQTTCDKIIATKKTGHKIVAVGTTSVRSIETASKSGDIKPYAGDTNIFIYPGYKFHNTDILITNFHLPKTSLLMLVCAFAGYENTMRVYAEAIQQQYRFYSYGDAMIII